MNCKPEEIRQYLIEWNEANTDKFYEASNKVWHTPELPMQEYKCSAIMIDLLEENGFDVEKGVAGMPTAFVATYGSGKPVIGINAEYDGLPGLSQSATALKKEAIVPGAPGHGCGHNLFGTASIKAAIAVKNAMEKFTLPGTIKVLGAAAEEMALGKPLLGKDGYLKGYDAILDWHPWCYNRADYDSCNAYFSVKYHFKGKTAHGNSPWHGRSALDAAMLMSHAVELMREHIYPGNPPEAANTINFTFLDTGPELPNVVPDRTTINYVGRFVLTEEAESSLKRITKCAEGAAIATETEVETEIITATHHKIPNEALAEVVHKNFQFVGPPQFTEAEHDVAKAIQKEMGAPETGLPMEIMPYGGGSTALCDTSEYSWNAPYATVWVAMAPQGIGWHNWGVVRCSGDTMGKKGLDTSAKVLSLSAIDLFTGPDILDRAQKELKEKLDGKTYKCLLPEGYEAPVRFNEEAMNKYR